MAKGKTTQGRCEAACPKRIRRARAIVQDDGTGESAPDAIRDLLTAPADKGESLFPEADFPMPGARARNHVLALEDTDGALTVAQRAAGKILACRASPGSDLGVVWLGGGWR